MNIKMYESIYIYLYEKYRSNVELNANTGYLSFVSLAFCFLDFIHTMIHDSKITCRKKKLYHNIQSSDNFKSFYFKNGLPRHGFYLGSWSRTADGFSDALSATLSFSDLLEIEIALSEIETALPKIETDMPEISGRQGSHNFRQGSRDF